MRLEVVEMYPHEEVGFIGFLLDQMEKAKGERDRDLYCHNFDETYERRKERYKELTGKEWGEDN